MARAMPLIDMAVAQKNSAPATVRAFRSATSA